MHLASVIWCVYYTHFHPCGTEMFAAKQDERWQMYTCETIASHPIQLSRNTSFLSKKKLILYLRPIFLFIGCFSRQNSFTIWWLCEILIDGSRIPVHRLYFILWPTWEIKRRAKENTKIKINGAPARIFHFCESSGKTCPNAFVIYISHQFLFTSLNHLATFRFDQQIFTTKTKKSILTL